MGQLPTEDTKLLIIIRLFLRKRVSPLYLKRGLLPEAAPTTRRAEAVLKVPTTRRTEAAPKAPTTRRTEAAPKVPTTRPEEVVPKAPTTRRAEVAPKAPTTLHLRVEALRTTIWHPMRTSLLLPVQNRTILYLLPPSKALTAPEIIFGIIMPIQKMIT